jgi:hypothetical protein
MTRELIELTGWVGSGIALLSLTAKVAGAETFDPATLKRFTDGAPYLSKYETGLYPGAKNEMPEPHQESGERVAAAIRPLDAEGKPDDAGRILALVMGHSNCRMYFGALEKHLTEHRAELHPRFELLNAAVGGQQLPQLVQLEGPVWELSAKLLSRPGYSPQQVQVLFLHTTYHGAGNRNHVPPGPFPETLQQMQRDLVKVLNHCLHLYPNLRLAYITADGFRHFTNFEPHVWQEAFAMKWLIESQLKGEPGTEFEGADRKLPWLTWGPYIWDNAWDQSYFTDGVHPAPKALSIFVESYWQHLAGDSVAKRWLMRSAGS